MYDFDTAVERRGTGSVKWNAVKEGELPMWVADMDFMTAPEIVETIVKRAEHGVFGYSDVPDEWGAAYRDWWRGRHGLECEADDFIFCTGVIPALSTAVRKLTTPAEKVLIETPVYDTFRNSIYNNGRYIVESPLVYDGHEYHRDWELFEQNLSDPQVTMMILCNPHNPIGKIWSRDELARVGELCRKHHVTVVSDEIHCDLTDPGRDYVPFASASEVCRGIAVMCVAPTKTFNLAGIQTAAVAAFDPLLHQRMWRGLNTDEVAEPNAFAAGAAVAAFTKGGEWLRELREYIYENKRYVRNALETVDGVKLLPSEATYLLWLDVSALTDDSTSFAAFVREKTGLFVTAGAQYHGDGNRFLRMNIACPKSRVADGTERLCRAVKMWRER